jgi:Kef-type K+ transport system membrane component KefB/predicted amino acid-binding ACT domain protein
MNAVVFSAGAQGVDFGQIFTTLAIVLIVAKIASELCERAGVPAVLGEIVAGILIGPSALGLVEPSDALRVLAEVGVIVLLAEVGLEMDLNELRRVGRASFIVAILGVTLPMSSGIVAGSLLGESLNASLFLGAALAATSVGITARVFGDLKALSSTEARIVLGAAVADDVLGLIILTVVTRVVEQGSIDAAGLASTIGLAVGFLLLAGAVGLLLLPRIIKWISARAASPVTVGVVAAGITFGFSAAASGAKLAPIIGAFVAGAALARTEHHDRIARDFAVLGSIFIPVFFMQIGIDTDVTKFFDGHVLIVAAILSVIAIAGKMLAALGALGTNTDKLVIGFGMVPRGEVGLIFASIGVSVGVFKDDLYAVVLLMVLVTTVVTPPLLRWRITRNDISASTGDTPTETDEPAGGWIRAIDGEVQLHGTPPASLVLPLALEASLHAAHSQPNSALLDWMHANRTSTLSWDLHSTDLLIDLLMRGNARSWRFLDVTNVLNRALPEVAQALRTRRGDASELDPTHHAQTPVLEALKKLSSRLSPTDAPLLLAAFVADFSDEADASTLLDYLALDDTTREETIALLSASALLHATCTTEPYEPDNRVLAQLAGFLATPVMVERCRLLTEAKGNLQDWQFSVLVDITTNVQSLLAHPELIEGSENSIIEVRRRDAIALTSDPLVIERLGQAASVYLLAHEPEVLVRHASLVEPAPRPRTVRVNVHPTDVSNEWEIDIATRDMRGLLARICSVLAERGLDIVNADLATWGDGAVLDTFRVRSEQRPQAPQLAFELEKRLRRKIDDPRRLMRAPDAVLSMSLDNDAHPWHSVVTVIGSDQPGLIQAIASAFARARISVHHARISTADGAVSDRFEVSTRHGRKITDAALARVHDLLN